MGFLFNGTPPADWTAPTTSTSTMPDWWQSAQQGLISQASQIAAQPYPLFPGPEVASWDPAQQSAYNNANNGQPQVQSDLTGGANTLNTAAANGENLNQNSLNSYMNPYTQNVVGDIATLGDQNLMQNILPQVNDTFTGAGQFGSNRNADFTNRAILNEEQNIGQQQDAALNQGFQQAVGATQTGNSQALQAGSALGALGQTTQATNAAQTGLNYNLGAAAQGQQQANLSNAYTNFENQASYPLQQLGILQSTIDQSQPTATYFGYQGSPLSGSANMNSNLNNVAASASGVLGSLPPA